MNRPGFIMAFLWATSLLSVCAVEYETGTLIEEVRCKQVQGYSYMLYLPSGYTRDREAQWPALFVMGPEGGTEAGLKRYIKGAEKNGWIVAMSIQSKDHFDGSRKAVAAMVVDVMDRFAVDDRRCYASGMSGGARLAFWLANEQRKMIIGLIPCSGGDTGYRYTRGAHAYGLCGGYSFTRWEMAVTFKEHVRDKGRLRFFEGGDSWANEDLIFDAMTWLNAQYLAKKGAPDEVTSFSEMLYNEILEGYEKDLFSTYERALILSGMTKAPHAELCRALVATLEENEKIQRYLEGLEAMDDFVEKHFNTTAGDYRNKRLTRQQKEDADELLEKYAETPLAPIIRNFATPSKKF